MQEKHTGGVRMPACVPEQSHIVKSLKDKLRELYCIADFTKQSLVQEQWKCSQYGPRVNPREVMHCQLHKEFTCQEQSKCSKQVKDKSNGSLLDFWKWDLVYRCTMETWECRQNVKWKHSQGTIQGGCIADVRRMYYHTSRILHGHWTVPRTAIEHYRVPWTVSEPFVNCQLNPGYT